MILHLDERSLSELLLEKLYLAHLFLDQNFLNLVVTNVITYKMVHGLSQLTVFCDLGLGTSFAATKCTGTAHLCPSWWPKPVSTNQSTGYPPADQSQTRKQGRSHPFQDQFCHQASLYQLGNQFGAAASLVDKSLVKNNGFW